MKKLLTLLLLSTLLIACHTQKNIHCVIETNMGNIGIELYPQKAPITVGNFMTYVDKQLYNNSSFFRVCTPQNEADRNIKIEVIQGGNVPTNQQLDSIALETTNKTKLLHKNGTLSMARGGPQSATSEFFICINNQPELNFGGKRNPDGQGFAAFGQVTSGMDVVKKIQLQPDNKQYLVQPIVIKTIRRVK